MNLHPYLSEDKCIVTVVLATAVEMNYFNNITHTHSEYTTDFEEYLDEVCPKSCISNHITYDINDTKIIAKINCYMHTDVGQAVYNLLENNAKYKEYSDKKAEEFAKCMERE